MLFASFLFCCIMYGVGRLAQLARASGLHPEGRRFEPCIAHFISGIRRSVFLSGGTSHSPFRVPMYRPVGVVLGVSLSEAARNGLCFVPYLFAVSFGVYFSLVGRGGLVGVWLWDAPSAGLQLFRCLLGVGTVGTLVWNGGIVVGMEPVVLYEDEYLVAIDKPAGLVVHRGVGTGETLVDWILERYPSMRLVGESDCQLPRPGMVHRLDKDTSGVMVLAKQQEMFIALKKHFQKGKVEKEYHSFVYGTPREARGTVTLSIGKSRADFRRFATRHTRGQVRDARTEYVVVGSCAEGSSFVRFYPKTGRTHQIRVHAQSLHTPIVCDSLYAASQEPLLGFSRLALHSRRVSLRVHWYREVLHLVAPHPADFLEAFSYCDSAVQKSVSFPQ